MARHREKRRDLPERVRFQHGAYYYVAPGRKWLHLGRNYSEAMLEWTKLVHTPTSASNMGDLFDRYAREVIPTKREATQRDNFRELRFLRAFFSAMPPRSVTPQHIAQYRDTRKAKVRGNREIALLSHAFSKAAEWGDVTVNPCREVRRNKERPRTRYIQDAEFAAFRALCPAKWQCYLDLKLLVGLRQQDMLALTLADITDRGLRAFIQKTQIPALFLWIPELEAAVARAQALPRHPRGKHLFCTRKGEAFSASGFASIWQRLMRKYVTGGGVRFTEHDIRGKVATDADIIGVNAQQLMVHKSPATTADYIRDKGPEKVVSLTRRT